MDSYIIKYFVTGIFHLMFLRFTHDTSWLEFVPFSRQVLFHYEYTISLRIHLPVDSHLDCFQFAAIMNSAAMNITVHAYLCVDRLFSFPLSRSPEVQLLGYTVSLCLAFQETAKFFFILTVPAYISTSNAWGFQFPHVLTNTWYC